VRSASSAPAPECEPCPSERAHRDRADGREQARLAQAAASRHAEEACKRAEERKQAANERVDRAKHAEEEARKRAEEALRHAEEARKGVEEARRRADAAREAESARLREQLKRERAERDEAERKQAANDRVERAKREEDRENEMEQIRQRFQPELQAAFTRGVASFLEHIYAKHPPTLAGTRPQLTSEAITGENLRGTVKKASLNYHPDRQVRADLEWSVLSAEIQQLLNRCKDKLDGRT